MTDGLREQVFRAIDDAGIGTNLAAKIEATNSVMAIIRRHDREREETDDQQD